jgi:hypothetical protein
VSLFILVIPIEHAWLYDLKVEVLLQLLYFRTLPATNSYPKERKPIMSFEHVTLLVTKHDDPASGRGTDLWCTKAVLSDN